MFIPHDTRIWELFNENNESLGAHLYGDIILSYSPNQTTAIHLAYHYLASINYTHKVIGDIYPLDEDSDNKLVQEIKLRWRVKEAKRELKHRKKRGFKLNSVIKFGKHSGKTLEHIIKNERSYWNWMVKNKVLLLHPELDQFIN